MRYLIKIETPPTTKEYLSVYTLMDDAELTGARLERPDLLFSVIPEDSPDYQEIFSGVETPQVAVEKTESITGMSLPVLTEKEC